MKQAIVLTLLLCIGGCTMTLDLPEKITTQTLNEHLESTEYILLDVRTNQEIAMHKVDHPNYMHIDFYDEDFEEQIKELDKSKTYIIMCNSGNRSAQTQQLMNKLGFTSSDVVGGIQDWMQQGFKTTMNNNAFL